MRGNNKDWMAIVYLTCAVVLWGGNWVAVRYTVQELSPLIVLTIRTLLSLLILMLMLKVTGSKKPQGRQLYQFAWLGLVGIVGFNLLQYLGLKYTTAINGSLINAATPIMTVILSSLIINEKVSRVQLTGILVSFLGVGWVITKGSWEILSRLKFNQGDFLILLAALCWSIYTIFGRKPTLEYSSIAVTAYASMFAAIYFTPLGVYQFSIRPVQSLSWVTVLAVAYTVLVGVFALVTWIKGVSLVGPSRASVFMNLLPLFTVLFASALLGEAITRNQITGGILVLGGVYLTTAPNFALRVRRP